MNFAEGRTPRLDKQARNLAFEWDMVPLNTNFGSNFAVAGGKIGQRKYGRAWQRGLNR